jgi:uncharacterized membrane protein
MKRIRFNIASLLGIILVLGIGFAALRESTELWSSGVFTLTLAALLISILLTVHRIENRRAFWLGFALFGSAYLGLSLVPSIESRLITTKALAYLDSKVPGRLSGPPTDISSLIGLGAVNNQDTSVNFALAGIQAATARQDQITFWAAATGKLLGGRNGTTENFVSIGHSLFALLAGWFGGLLSRRLCRSSRPAED